MRIGVIVNPVADITSKIDLNASGNIKEESLQYDFNVYDLYALEEALRIKDVVVDTEVVCISIGKCGCKQILNQGLAMGADRARWIQIQKEDILVPEMALLMKETIREEKFDLIITGKEIVDRKETGITEYLGVCLNIPYVSSVIQLNVEEESLVAYQQNEDGSQSVLKCTLPAIIGVTKGINNPRYTTLKGIMQAKKKELNILDGEQYCQYDSRLSCVSKTITNGKKTCTMVGTKEDGLKAILDIIDESIAKL